MEHGPLEPRPQNLLGPLAGHSTGATDSVRGHRLRDLAAETVSGSQPPRPLHAWDRRLGLVDLVRAALLRVGTNREGGGTGPRLRSSSTPRSTAPSRTAGSQQPRPGPALELLQLAASEADACPSGTPKGATGRRWGIRGTRTTPSQSRAIRGAAGRPEVRFGAPPLGIETSGSADGGDASGYYCGRPASPSKTVMPMVSRGQRNTSWIRARRLWWRVGIGGCRRR